MDYSNINEYLEKITFAEEAAKLVSSGSIIRYAFGDCCTTALDTALAQRKDELRDIRICSDPQYRHFQVFYSSKNPIMRNSKSQQRLVSIGDLMQKTGNCGNDSSCIPQLIFMAVVSPMDKDGRFWLAPGTCLNEYRNEIPMSKYVIVEVNENIHWASAISDYIHISKINYVVPGHNPPIVKAAPQRNHVSIGKQTNYYYAYL